LPLSVLRMHHFGDVQYKEINRVIGGEPQTETQTILPYTDCKEIAVLGLGTCRKMGPIGNTQEDFELFEQGRAVLRTVYMQLNPIQ